MNDSDHVSDEHNHTDDYSKSSLSLTGSIAMGTGDLPP